MGLPWTSVWQVAETAAYITQQTQDTGIRVAGGIRTHNPCSRGSTDARLGPRRRWDWRLYFWRRSVLFVLMHSVIAVFVPFVPTIQVFFLSVRHFYSVFTCPNVTISIVIFCFSSKVCDPFPVLVYLNKMGNVH
jgi:hypothetical protein